MASAFDSVGRIVAELENSNKLHRSCRWHILRKNNLDDFRRELTDSGEYAAFLIRAVIGDLIQDGSASSYIVEWSDDTIELTDVCRQLIADANEDEERKLGAELVARASLLAAWEICQQDDFKEFVPNLDFTDNRSFPGDGIGGKRRLSFLSADFVKARLRNKNKDIKPYRSSNGEMVSYFDYGWEDDKPPTDGGWVSHGWRMKSERKFLNNPKAPEDGVQTFLGFPAFFSHEAANISFHFPCDNPESQLNLIDYGSDSEMTELRTRGIEPYLNAKKDEFEDRKKLKPEILGSITSCIGVASYQGASFVAERFNAGYGVFLTVDIEKHETTERGCLSEHTCSSVAKPICLHPATQAMRNVQHRIRFKTLQVLATTLASEREQKVMELAKYKEMYRLLKDPLDRLTNAVKESQIDAYQIGATLFEPVDVFFDAKRQVHELFQQGRSVEVSPAKFEIKDGLSVEIRAAKSIVIKHQPSLYEPADAEAVAICALSRLIPKAQNGTDWYSSNYAAVIRSLLEISETRSSPHRALSRALGRLLNKGSGWNSSTGAIPLLEEIKKVFYTLHKPDEAVSALHWEALRPYLSTIELCGSDVRFLDLSKSEGQELIGKKKNPLATHGQLVEFIVRVIAQHVDYNKIINTKDLTFCTTDKFQVKSEKVWIASDKIEEMLSLMKSLLKARAEGLRTERNFGDFKKPFVTLIERIPHDRLPDSSAYGSSSEKKLVIRIGRLCIEFVDKEFGISTSDSTATGGGT